MKGRQAIQDSSRDSKETGKIRQVFGNVTSKEVKSQCGSKDVRIQCDYKGSQLSQAEMMKRKRKKIEEEARI